MKNPLEYRMQARASLQNRWGEAAIVRALILALVIICSIPSMLEAMNDVLKIDFLDSTWWNLLGSSATSFLSMLVVPIQYAFSIALLNMTRGSETNLLQSTVQHSRMSYIRLFFAGLIISLITTLVGLVTLGIGAVILGYTYRMVPYLLSDFSNISIREAMKVSREMMYGYKWRLFMLDLSFIGWIVFSFITLGLGTLFVVPYMETACALFYDDLKNERLIVTED